MKKFRVVLIWSGINVMLSPLVGTMLGQLQVPWLLGIYATLIFAMAPLALLTWQIASEDASPPVSSNK